jgi:hypothetical protein
LSLGNIAFAQQAVANIDAVVTYTEPDRLQGGGNLTQLTHTTMYFEVRDVGGVVLDQWTHQMVASDPTGGGGVIYTLPPKVITEEAVLLMVWASATNNIGEGPKSAAASKAIPKIDLKVPDGIMNLDINISISVTVP